MQNYDLYSNKRNDFQKYSTKNKKHRQNACFSKKMIKFVFPNLKNSSMKLNCIVVDDSSIQRMIISKLIKNSPSLNLVSDFSNAIEAKTFVTVNQIDLIFLDIEMPIIDGFDFLDGLRRKPQVIFVTAKGDYAVKAFDYEATDYLQKPISLERFEQAVKKAMLKHQVFSDNNIDEDFIFVKSNLKKLKIFTSKIKWIEAFGDYVKIVTDEDSNMVLSTMKSFESTLPKERFLRVHKSYIINLEKIERFNSKFAEIGITKIPLSRNRKEDIKKALMVS